MNKVYWISLTGNCNFRCSYCFQNLNGSFRNSGDMNAYTAQRVAELINCTCEKVYKVHFFGGEPFLNFKVMKLITESVKDKVDFFSVTTNLSILNSEIIEFLENNDFHLLVSLDGIKASHDVSRVFADGSATFSTVVGNLNLLSQKLKKDSISIAKTLTVKNYMNLFEDYIFFKALGFKVNVNPDINLDTSELDSEIFKNGLKKIMTDMVSDNESIEFWNLRESIRTVKDFSCGKKIRSSLSSCYDASNYVTTISPRGDLYPCHYLYEMEEKYNGTHNIFGFNDVRQIEGTFIRNVAESAVFVPLKESEVNALTQYGIDDCGCNDCRYLSFCAEQKYYAAQISCFYRRYKFRKGVTEKNKSRRICIDKIIYDAALQMKRE